MANGNGEIEDMGAEEESWMPTSDWEGASQPPPFAGPWPPRPLPPGPGVHPPPGPGRPPGPPWAPGWATRPPSWAPGWKGRPPPGYYDWYFYWGYRLRNAWKDIKYLRELVTEITNEEILQAIRDGIIAPGPNSPVPGPGTGGGGTTALTGPIVGVTDGSAAAAGMVGELLTGSVSGSIPMAESTQSWAPLIVTPGDWDAQAVMEAQWTWGVSLVLSPVPAGASNDMAVLIAPFSGAGYGETQQTVITPLARISVSVSTPLVFVLHTNFQGNTQAVRPFTLRAQARRVR